MARKSLEATRILTGFSSYSHPTAASGPRTLAARGAAPGADSGPAGPRHGRLSSVLQQERVTNQLVVVIDKLPGQLAGFHKPHDRAFADIEPAGCDAVRERERQLHNPSFIGIVNERIS